MERPASSAEATAPSHEFVDHTSELTIRLRAGTFPELLAESGRAMGELMTRSRPKAPSEGWREVAAKGPDEAALLVAWLNELVYLGEVEQWAPAEIDIRVAEPGGEGVRARVRGVSLAKPFVLVKAATLHGLTIRRVGKGLEAEVTLDV
jgi:SHS2 domain-containing protein